MGFPRVYFFEVFQHYGIFVGNILGCLIHLALRHNVPEVTVLKEPNHECNETGLNWSWQIFTFVRIGGQMVLENLKATDWLFDLGKLVDGFLSNLLTSSCKLKKLWEVLVLVQHTYNNIGDISALVFGLQGLWCSLSLAVHDLEGVLCLQMERMWEFSITLLFLLLLNENTSFRECLFLGDKLLIHVAWFSPHLMNKAVLSRNVNVINFPKLDLISNSQPILIFILFRLIILLEIAIKFSVVV